MKFAYCIGCREKKRVLWFPNAKRKILKLNHKRIQKCIGNWIICAKCIFKNCWIYARYYFSDIHRPIRRKGGEIDGCFQNCWFALCHAFDSGGKSHWFLSHKWPWCLWGQLFQMEHVRPWSMKRSCSEESANKKRSCIKMEVIKHERYDKIKIMLWNRR